MLAIFIVNASIFGLLGMVWEKSDWLNVFIKFALISATVVNAYYAWNLIG